MRKSVREVHGDTKTDLYSKWGSMVNRCKRGVYFKKGITVCSEWVNSYLAFKEWALSNGYKEGLELDRKENDKGYSPDNCRFVTRLVNNSNRSNTIFIDYKGERTSLTLYAEKNNLPLNVYNTIRRRISNGWDVERAIETPVREGGYGHKGTTDVINTETGQVFNSVQEAAASIGILPKNLSSMLNGKRKNTSKFKKAW